MIPPFYIFTQCIRLSRYLKYPELQLYSDDVTVKAETSTTYNWFSLPSAIWPKYEHLGAKISENYMRPVFSNGDSEFPCTVFKTSQAGEIDIKVGHFPHPTALQGILRAGAEIYILELPPHPVKYLGEAVKYNVFPIECKTIHY